MNTYVYVNITRKGEGIQHTIRSNINVARLTIISRNTVEEMFFSFFLSSFAFLCEYFCEHVLYF